MTCFKCDLGATQGLVKGQLAVREVVINCATKVYLFSS